MNPFEFDNRIKTGYNGCDANCNFSPTWWKTVKTGTSLTINEWNSGGLMAFYRGAFSFNNDTVTKKIFHENRFFIYAIDDTPLSDICVRNRREPIYTSLAQGYIIIYKSLDRHYILNLATGNFDALSILINEDQPANITLDGITPANHSISFISVSNPFNTVELAYSLKLMIVARLGDGSNWTTLERVFLYNSLSTGKIDSLHPRFTIGTGGDFEDLPIESNNSIALGFSSSVTQMCTMSGSGGLDNCQLLYFSIGQDNGCASSNTAWFFVTLIIVFFLYILLLIYVFAR